MPRREASSQPRDLDSTQKTRAYGAAPAARAPLASYEPGDTYGRYQLVRPVAEGGMATVWLARLRGEYGFERDVAIKMILPAYARQSNYRDMFLDEARIASRVQHPNVAQILDLGEHDGKLYMVMEWVDGDSLFNLINAAEAQGRAVPLGVLLRIIADACAGLHAAHELRDARGHKLEVVHRDVSPQNILVGSSGCVKVIDFGVLKARGRIVEETLDGIVKGKLHYVAPERALGVSADCRADIWALGAILYRVLGGRPVYEGQGNLAVVRELIAQGDVRALPERVPRELREIVYKALARRPADRYQTMAELERALESLLHSFAAATTSADVAELLASALDSSPSEPNDEADITTEIQSETSTVRLVSSPSSARLALVPTSPLPVCWTDAGAEKPPVRLLSELEGYVTPPSHTRHRSWIRGSLVSLSGLVAIAGLCSAGLAVSNRATHASESHTPSSDTSMVTTRSPVPTARKSEPPSQALPAVTPAALTKVLSVVDLPLEPATEARAPSPASRPSPRRTHARPSHASH